MLFFFLCFVCVFDNQDRCKKKKYIPWPKWAIALRNKEAILPLTTLFIAPTEIADVIIAGNRLVLSATVVHTLSFLAISLTTHRLLQCSAEGSLPHSRQHEVHRPSIVMGPGCKNPHYRGKEENAIDQYSRETQSVYRN